MSNKKPEDPDEYEKKKAEPAGGKTEEITNWECCSDSAQVRGSSMRSVLTLRVIITLVACFLLEFTTGIQYVFGNFLPYLTSYQRQNNVTASVDYSMMMWVGESSRMTFSVAMPVTGLIERRLPPRLNMFLGCFAFMATFFGSYWAVQNSFAALLVTYGAFLGIGKAILYPLVVALALKWLPHRKGLVAGLVMAGYGGGALVWNQVITNWINPDNLQPDLKIEHDLYFTQSELFSRVPTCFLLMGGLVCGTQLLCISVVTFPPSNDSATLEVEHPDTSETEQPKPDEACEVEDHDQTGGKQELKHPKTAHCLQEDSPNPQIKILNIANDPPDMLLNGGQQEASKRILELSNSGTDSTPGKSTQKTPTENNSDYDKPSVNSSPSVSSRTPKTATDCQPSVSNTIVIDEDASDKLQLPKDNAVEYICLEKTPTEDKQQQVLCDDYKTQNQNGNADDDDKQMILDPSSESDKKKRVVFDESEPVVIDHVTSGHHGIAAEVDNIDETQPISSQNPVDYTPLQLLRSRAAWTVCLLYFFTELTIIFITDLYKAYGQTFIHDDHFLAIVASCTAIFNCVGRPVWGAVADRYGYLSTLLSAQAMLSIAASTFLVTEQTDRAGYAVWVFVMYFAISGIYALEPPLIFSLFGPSYFISNLGIIRLTGILSSLMSVFVASAAKNAFGWHGIFLLGAASTLIGMAVNMSFMLKCGPDIPLHMEQVLFPGRQYNNII